MSSIVLYLKITNSSLNHPRLYVYAYKIKYEQLIKQVKVSYKSIKSIWTAATCVKIYKLDLIEFCIRWF